VSANTAPPSFWLADLDGDPLRPRPPLPASTDADVVVVGAGFTGLWTAWYLRRADPTLRVVVLEAEVAGFGASGRNGGWCSALLPMGLGAVAARHGLPAALAQQRAMIATVGEVGRASAEAGIDCRFAHGGTVVLARNAAQAARLQADVADAHRVGLTPDDLDWLGPADARALVAAERVVGATVTPHCAALHPGRLVRGLAGAVEAVGARLHEGTRVTRIDPGRVRTEHGDVRAGVVVRATEAFTAALPGLRRRLLPIYSLMLATEPLPDSFWESVGWRRRETLADARRSVIYGQRTADGRIAFGGRGAPYHYASRVRPAYDRDPGVHAELERTLVDLFPALAGVGITHRWGGPLAAARDWHCAVGVDRRTGMAWAGGYVGDGVATANLAGRTLTDLILGRDTELTRLPWVGHRSRRWEPEPLRWLGVRAALALPGTVDRREAAGGSAGLAGRALDRLLGH
jgi:glycine/D-amino acid oxidase-like deaminating enzyme